MEQCYLKHNIRKAKLVSERGRKRFNQSDRTSSVNFQLIIFVKCALPSCVINYFQSCNFMFEMEVDQLVDVGDFPFEEEKALNGNGIQPENFVPCAIIYDSILKNKKKTQTYWENRMSADVQGLINIKHSMEGKESLIEREIRLQKEREEALANERKKAFELAKESKDEDSNDSAQIPHVNGIERGKGDLRLTHEIKMVRQESAENQPTPPSGFLITMNSEPAKVPKPAQRTSLNKKFSSMSNISVLGLDTQLSVSGERRGTKTPTTPIGNGKTPPITFKTQKGLMQKFLETHGRKVPTPNNTPPTPTTPQAPVLSIPRRKMEFLELTNEQPQNHPNWTKRPGYVSTEDKIQKELEEMRKRESELKAERARVMGLSQPNLQLVGLDDESDDNDSGTESIGQLRSALSNPNLLEENATMLYKGPQKRRSALIDAWENRIKNEQNSCN